MVTDTMFTRYIQARCELRIRGKDKEKAVAQAEAAKAVGLFTES